MAGGTGFLGRALSLALTSAGHEVVVLSRGGRLAGTIHWTPDGTVGPWAAALDGADAVINLAGESIAAGRWNAARKATILQSRLRATGSLVGAIRSVGRPPATLISASAQGYYGDRGDEELSEDAAPGRDFMADVCARWEASALEAAPAVRVVLLRTGIVLASDQGALPRMLLPFKLMAGGPLGSGRQFVSWVHWRDWVSMAVWALNTDAVTGPLNLSAPVAVRNTEFSSAIARALHRPSWLPAPAFALRAVLGEMADALLLGSIRMVPGKAMALGYRFEFAELDAALRNLLNRGD